MKPRNVAAALSAGLLLLTGCGGEHKSVSGANDATVTIGYLGNLTGESSGPYGVPFNNGMKLALDDIEESGYLKDAGLDIKVLTEDTGSELNTAVTKYNALRSKGVDLVLSDSMTPIAAGLAPLTTADQLVFLTGSGSPIENADGFAFHLADLGTPMVTLGQDAATQGLENVVAVVDGDNPAFGTMAKSFEQGMKDAGGSGFADTITVTEADTDFTGIMTKLESSGADGVFVSLLSEGSGNVLRQMEQYGGLDDLAKLGTIAWSSQVYEVAQEAAVGSHFALPWAPGLTSSSDFEAAYREAYDATPNAYSAIGYETAWLVAAAAVEAQKAGGVSSESIKDALPSASTSDVLAEHGVIEGFSLDPAGDPAYPGTVATFSDDGSIVAATR
jgi:branched-chain amino acid transport system substrate-binding protein